MNIDTELTIFEGKVYRELKQRKFIRWCNVVASETSALNRLVKKGLAVNSIDDKNYKGWMEKKEG